ncbi:MAG: beta-lactamase domain-containing protein [Candidatus Scalindua rubra]|uniref:Beta-lactamase domain-containing protein n=1 Tax=Candidatus Scalindua rubra TaxID=1872076 RepID=A0A1E3X4L5_9BACT|nr:MAG: beta-lactamase domain-containing protein [Candidatus Scalindua rubra]
MKLTILGSGTGIVTARRSPSGYLININDKTLLLDSGSGTLRKIAEASSSFKDIDYAIYTHFHPDHVVDLISLLFALRIPSNYKSKNLTVIGPSGMKDFYQNLTKVFNNFIDPRGYDLVINELSGDHLDFKDFRITSSLIKHHVNSLAYRIESKEGKTLVYSGDTDYCKGIVDLAKDVDVLLLECSYPKHIKVEGHLNSTLAGRIARESNCKKLILTHFYPICDDYDILGQCKEEFSGEILLAEDLMTIEI